MNSNHHATVVRVVSPCAAELSEICVEDVEQRMVSERFGIADARELMRLAYQRPREGETQVLMVCTDFITHEAQNALLKVLEEPPLSTRFLFVLPPDFILLPTLASRFQTSEVGQAGVEQSNDFTEFLTFSYKERISLVEAKMKQGDSTWQRAMKHGLIEYLKSGHHQPKLSELEYVARTVLTRGASNKMLLEQLALTLPVS